MASWEIVLICLIPLYAFILFIPLSYFVDYEMKKGNAKACLASENFIKSPYFGLVTYLCGNIGAGKTTCGSAICNVLAKIKKEQAMNKVSELQNIFYDIDFNFTNKFLDFAYNNLHFTNADALMNFIFDKDSQIKKKMKDRYYDNYLFPTSYSSLFRDYIKAYIALLRNRYVYHQRRRFYCWSTNNWAMEYSPSMIDIKDRYLTDDYTIQNYTTIFEDEKIANGKSNTNRNNIAKEDAGGDMFFRFIRHFGKGTIHYVSTAQDFDRVVKQERELATGIFYIKRRTEIEQLSLHRIFLLIEEEFISCWQSTYLDLVERRRLAKLEILSKRMKVIEKMIKEKSVDKTVSDIDPTLLDEIKKYSDSTLFKPSKFKKLLYKIQRKKAKQFASSYILYEGDYYTNASALDEKSQASPNEKFKVKLTFPLPYAYGSVDTYAFSILSDILSLKSIGKSDWYDPKDDGIPHLNDEEFDRWASDIFKRNQDRTNNVVSPSSSSSSTIGF